MRRGKLCGFITGAMLAGCCPTNQLHSENTTPDPAPATPDEISALLVDVMTPRICEELQGSFVGLPGDEGSEGAAAGADPTVGRWWVRSCSAVARDGRLTLEMSGPGWTWIDREASGFRIRQYLRFDAQARIEAAVMVGYDRTRRVATLWMQPGEGVTATVTPVGLVTAETTGALGTFLGGLLSLTGDSADDRARAQVAEEGSDRLRARLSNGFTLTYVIDQGQVDFMVGALPRGEVPQRPFPAEPGVTWSVNQRLRVWPSGLDVVGPVDVSQHLHSLDIELEEGQGVQVRAVCSEPFGRFYDLSLQGAATSVPEGPIVAEIRSAGQVMRAPVPVLQCPVLLLVEPLAGTSLPVQARLRVSRADPNALAPPPQQNSSLPPGTNPPSPNGNPPPVTPQPGWRIVRVQVGALEVTPQDPNGTDWDVVGGEADTYVIVASVPAGREVLRTPPVQDRNSVNVDRWLPGAFRREELPLRFTVYDEDVTADALIGTVDLDPARIVGTGEVGLALRSVGPVPAQTGTLRVRVQIVE